MPPLYRYLPDRVSGMTVVIAPHRTRYDRPAIGGIQDA